jgi:hypothetical protein
MNGEQKIVDTITEPLYFHGQKRYLVRNEVQLAKEETKKQTYQCQHKSFRRRNNWHSKQNVNIEKEEKEN